MSALGGGPKRALPLSASASGAETLAARATGRGIGILHLEAALQQRLHIVQLAAGHVERALGIDHHLDTGAFDQNVARGRAILQVHFVLQSRTAAADHRDAQHAALPTLAGQQRAQLPSGVGRQFDEPLIADAEAGRYASLVCGGCHHVPVPQASAKARQRQPASAAGSGTVWTPVQTGGSFGLRVSVETREVFFRTRSNSAWVSAWDFNWSVWALGQ